MAEKINVVIAGRNYPLTINPSEETLIRDASKKINSMIKSFEQNYAINDTQDALSMCALQLASQLEKQKQKAEEKESEWCDKIDAISNTIDDNL